MFHVIIFTALTYDLLLLNRVANGWSIRPLFRAAFRSSAGHYAGPETKGS